MDQKFLVCYLLLAIILVAELIFIAMRSKPARLKVELSPNVIRTHLPASELPIFKTSPPTA